LGERRRPNVILLVIDTLREDHAGGLEALRDLGFVKYENAIAPSPWTLPAEPRQHGDWPVPEPARGPRGLRRLR